MKWCLLLCLLLVGLVASNSGTQEESKTLNVDNIDSEENNIKHGIQEEDIEILNIAENKKAKEKKNPKKKNGKKTGKRRSKNKKIKASKEKGSEKKKNKKTKTKLRNKKKRKNNKVHSTKEKRKRNKSKRIKKKKKRGNKKKKTKVTKNNNDKKAVKKKGRRGKKKKEKVRNNNSKKKAVKKKGRRGKNKEQKKGRKNTEKRKNIIEKNRRKRLRIKKKKMKNKKSEKKRGKKRRNNKIKNNNNSERQDITEDQCAEIILSRIKLERKAVNYMRQYNRSKRFLVKTDQKLKKKSEWAKSSAAQDPMSLLIKCGGNDEANMKCAGSTTSRKSQMMTTLMENLKNCTPNIGTKCKEDMMPVKGSEFDQCAKDLMAFQAISTQCLRLVGSKACECYNTDEAKDLYDKGKACSSPDMVKYERTVKNTKDNCVAKFRDCRVFQDELAVVMMTCCGEGGVCPT